MRLLAIGIVLLCTAAVFAPAQSSDSARKIVSRTDPHYPEMARQMRLQGMVKLSVLVAPNGYVKSIDALGGSPLLVKASQDAVSKWKWAPATQETTERIELRFTPD